LSQGVDDPRRRGDPVWPAPEGRVPFLRRRCRAARRPSHDPRRELRPGDRTPRTRAAGLRSADERARLPGEGHRGDTDPGPSARGQRALVLARHPGSPGPRGTRVPPGKLLRLQRGPASRDGPPGGGHVILTDVNERAAALARANIAANRIRNAEVRIGDVYGPVDDLLFDHIICSPPIRAGRVIVDRIIAEAPSHLLDGGSLWLVARTRQGADTLRLRMRNAFDGGDVVKRGSGYKVLRSVKSGA